VLGQAQEVLRLYGKLSTVSVDPAAEVRINIGAIASVQRAQLPAALAAFHRQCPGAHTRVIPGLSMELVNLVDAGELDFAAIIRPPFALQSDLRWSPIASEPFRLIVPRALEGDDWMALLAQQAFIRYDRASFGGRQVDRFLRRMQIVVQEVCELDELEAIVKLVGNGVGVALVPQTAAYAAPGRWPAAMRAVDLGHHTFHRDIGIVHRDAAQMSEAARVLLGLLAGQSASQTSS
jgi:DNA-binding transcriptional LysR family regulator